MKSTGDMNSMAVTTADITKAAKELTSLERKLAKLVANEKAAVQRRQRKHYLSTQKKSSTRRAM
jgi:hypothetical protein